MTQGVYALIIKNGKEQQISIGKLGTFFFYKGLYSYIGSALGKTATNIENRLKRHLSITKKLFWHIDFFLNSEKVEITTIIYASTAEKKECRLNSSILKIETANIPIPGFGSSDCTEKCGSHLIYFRLDESALIKSVKSSFKELGLTPIEYFNKFHDESILQ